MEIRKYKPEIKKASINMDPILKRIPPIEGVFSPNEEVNKLLAVPKTKRREAVGLFEKKLIHQREAWALCRVNIERRIESNPDLSREEMIGIIAEFASHYGFAEKDIRIAESLIDDYIETHKRVVEIRREFPDDIALINRLTGRKFSKSDAKDFKVSVGPISIEISCPGFNAGRIYEGSEKPVVGFKYAGFASESSDKTPIYYLVINSDYAIKNPNFHASTLPHEREHLKNRILKPKLYSTSKIRADMQEQLNKGVLGFLRHQIGERILGFERNFENELLKRYELTNNIEEKIFLLREYMRLKREHALNRAKDEIIAMKTEGPYKIIDYGVFLKQADSSYDYLAYIRDWHKKKGDNLWQKIAKKVLVDEYGKIIDEAVNAFDDLTWNGYSTKEATAILSDKRLSEWPKTVQRLFKQKKQNKQKFF